MRALRKDVNLHRHDLGKFYKCLTKVSYHSRLPATKAAYALEVIRPGRVYDVYSCNHCGHFHVGRKKPHAINIITKRKDWSWQFTNIGV